MVTKSTKAAAPKKKKKPVKEQPGSNDPAYVRLRTLLDSLELGSVRYFLSAPTAKGKEDRMEEVRTKLLPIIQWLWNRSTEGGECPDGYVDCHGCCVPYPCPDRY